MRTILPMSLLLPAAAQAHVGHLGEAAGHDHWVAGAAIGVAIALGLRAAWKERRKRPSDSAREDAPKDAEA